MKKKIKSILSIIVMLSLLGLGNLALASEVTGNLTTGTIGINSTVGTVIEGVVIAPPAISPIAGTYTSAQSVSLTANGSLSIHYTTDGSVPACSTGTVYSGAISVSSSQNIKAISCYQDNHSSSVASFAYIINISTGGSSSGGSSSGGGTPPSTPTYALGDANKDGKVDIFDFNLLMVNWGNNPTNPSADLNNDGKVDIFDFNILMINWTI